MNNSVEFKKIKWGALTKQLKEFNAKNNINFNLETRYFLYTFFCYLWLLYSFTILHE